MHSCLADPQAMFAELVRAGLQALIEAEAATKIGAERYERSEGRTTHRKDHRTKTVSTPAGEARIPRLRSGSFFPALWRIGPSGSASPRMRCVISGHRGRRISSLR